LGNTRFTEYIIHENALEENGFKEWIFRPGMLFNATEKWWGDQGKRDKPHEGLDLFIYRDLRENTRQLNEKTKIPVIFDGTVKAIFNDFLGKSLIIEHNLTDINDNRLCTIYGHINPGKTLQLGSKVKEGDIIASLAHPGNSKATIFSHLHVSLGWASKLISYDKLDWKKIGVTKTLNLIDPLGFIEWNYRILS
jgi:murein DD-endopeptidase MepM/ murein hydrolase activator NlpD